MVMYEDRQDVSVPPVLQGRGQRHLYSAAGASRLITDEPTIPLKPETPTNICGAYPLITTTLHYYREPN